MKSAVRLRSLSFHWQSCLAILCGSCASALAYDDPLLCVHACDEKVKAFR